MLLFAYKRLFFYYYYTLRVFVRASISLCLLPLTFIDNFWLYALPLLHLCISITVLYWMCASYVRFVWVWNQAVSWTLMLIWGNKNLSIKYTRPECFSDAIKSIAFSMHYVCWLWNATSMVLPISIFDAYVCTIFTNSIDIPWFNEAFYNNNVTQIIHDFRCVLFAVGEHRLEHEWVICRK